jgi:hypothetical protein
LCRPCGGEHRAREEDRRRRGEPADQGNGETTGERCSGEVGAVEAIHRAGRRAQDPRDRGADHEERSEQRGAQQDQSRQAEGAVEEFEGLDL